MIRQYAVVCPYVGWLEAYRMLRPLLDWLAAGLGFGLIVMLEHWWMRRRLNG